MVIHLIIYLCKMIKSQILDVKSSPENMRLIQTLIYIVVKGRMEAQIKEDSATLLNA